MKQWLGSSLSGCCSSQETPEISPRAERSR
jgi:hypothetical protein